MSTLRTVAQLKLEWLWTEPFDVANVVDKAKEQRNLTIEDAALQTAIWQDERTLPAGSVDQIDLDNLPLQTLAVEGVIRLTEIVQMFVENLESTAGAVIRIGTPSDGTASHYALEVGRGSYCYLSNLDGWAAAGRVMRIANPTSSPITYRIAFVGLGETVSA